MRLLAGAGAGAGWCWCRCWLELVPTPVCALQPTALCIDSYEYSTAVRPAAAHLASVQKRLAVLMRLVPVRLVPVRILLVRIKLMRIKLVLVGIRIILVRGLCASAATVKKSSIVSTRILGISRILGTPLRHFLSPTRVLGGFVGKRRTCATAAPPRHEKQHEGQGETGGQRRCAKASVPATVGPEPVREGKH